jgi:hypothetical protein
MFEEIFFPRNAERYRAAPLVEAGTISRSSPEDRRQTADIAEMRQ